MISGSKTFITNGSIADVLTVAAVTDPDAAAGQRISCFIVEPKEVAGFEASDLDKMGTRSSPLSLLRFSDCRVPADALLGEEGTALWKMAFECFDWERTVMIASAVGGMEAELSACIRYAKERRAFGRPIAEHQTVGHKLAEMKAWLDASRLLVYRAAWLKQEGLPHQVEASVAKYLTAEAALHGPTRPSRSTAATGTSRTFPSSARGATPGSSRSAGAPPRSRRRSSPACSWPRSDAPSGRR